MIGTQLIAIDSGSTTAVSPFVADEDFTGGATMTHANTINTSEVTNPAPAAVYQTGRDGNFSYTIGGFTAGTNYLVRLHFCETYFTSAGSRTFNVSINGTQVLTDFDIFAAAGGQNIANIQAVHGAGQFQRAVRDRVHVGREQLAGERHRRWIRHRQFLHAAPSAPSGLGATAISSSQINLSWTASTAGSGCSITYNVFRSTTSGFTAWERQPDRHRRDHDDVLEHGARGFDHVLLFGRRRGFGRFIHAVESGQRDDQRLVGIMHQHLH